MIFYDNRDYDRPQPDKDWGMLDSGVYGFITNVTQDTSINLQVGAKSGQLLNVKLPLMALDQLGLDKNILITDNDSVNFFLSVLDEALEHSSEELSKLGQFKIETAYNINSNNEYNTQSAESRIRDVDMAREMMQYTKSKILDESAQAILAQGNQNTRNILKLLG